jgi:hypothetical protein
MADHKPLVLGSEVLLTGDVTQNRWVGARSARDLERSLGYGAGRLANGWTILLLKQQLDPPDFKFSGITLRSGGREGLPAATPDADKARRHVSDAILMERGETGYLELQRRALREIAATGPVRIVKVIPTTPHSSSMQPSDQYPMGGGGLQWTLLKPCKFFVAMTVDANGIAILAATPPFSVFLGESARYEDRAKVAKFLDQA